LRILLLEHVAAAGFVAWSWRRTKGASSRACWPNLGALPAKLDRW